MAVATAIAIAGTVISAASAIDSRNARKDAAKEITQANVENANLLASQGKLAEADILLAQNKALESVALGTEEAVGRISPFVEPGQEAFRQAQEQILSGADVGGPLAESISQASISGVNPAIFDTSGPVGNEILRQGQLSVSGATPLFTQNLLNAGRQGISATGDVAGIESRGFNRAGDIIGGSSAQRASSLIGQIPQLSRLAAGAQEGRLLGEIGEDRFNVAAVTELAKLAGRAV